ncbi:MAG: ribosomal protein S18-alanine N-acetyltransferase [Clostridia bacterium]|nr:ribosomal protein S18-alanine N-acetyltransferase [Clostridia bacterium]
MTLRSWEFVDLIKIEKFHKENFIDAWTYSQLASSFLSDKFKGFLVEDNGEILGTVCYDLSIEEGDILHIVVKKEERKKGIATSLLERAFEEVKKIELKALFLEVRESNIPAIKTYEKAGFTKLAERKNYYSDKETAIVMKKEFSYNY